MVRFISGKKLLKQYLLDDLWETEKVDDLYNQSSLMLSKLVPTTFQRVCTMGTASVWNLLLTAWSYENNLAIPIPDKRDNFSGGLARCYKVGYSERVKKIDFASLYPMIQLTWDVFPMFDISGVIKKMLLYLTTTRNIYKKIGSGADLNTEEVELIKAIDHDIFEKYTDGTLTAKEESAKFKAAAQLNKYHFAKRNLFLNVKTAYFNMYELKEKEGIILENIAILKTFESLALNELENNRSTMVDVLKIRMEKNELSNQLNTVQENYNAKKIAFNFTFTFKSF
jgi:hypothetical protein